MSEILFANVDEQAPNITEPPQKANLWVIPKTPEREIRLPANSGSCKWCDCKLLDMESYQVHYYACNLMKPCKVCYPASLDETNDESSSDPPLSPVSDVVMQVDQLREIAPNLADTVGDCVQTVKIEAQDSTPSLYVKPKVTAEAEDMKPIITSPPSTERSRET